MNVAMMQPAFMPWQGFFALVMKADLFVFLDDFQFSVQSYHQRNKLLVSSDTADWYTVPVRKKAAFRQPINRVFPNNETNWKTKQMKRLSQMYGKTPFFEQVNAIVDDSLSADSSLAEINISLITSVVSFMGWQKQFACSSELDASGARTAKVIDILDKVGATRYLSAGGAFEYMRDDCYRNLTDIPAEFLLYEPLQYPQHGTSSFISHLSILDALFNIGPEATSALIARSTRWLSWEAAEEMHDA